MKLAGSGVEPQSTDHGRSLRQSRIAFDRLVLRCTVTAHERTGVEMEALTAVSLGLLAVWDMVKGLEKDAAGQYPHTQILELRVEEKRVERTPS